MVILLVIIHVVVCLFLIAVVLLQQGNWPMAALNIGLSVAAWLACVWLGHGLASRLNRWQGL